MKLLEGLGLAKELIGATIGSWSKRKEIEVQTRNQIKIIEAETKREIARSKLTMAEKGQAAELDWDMKMAEASETSWKDEVMMLAIVGPYVAVFFAPLQPYVAKGFDSLADLPEWYLASFGVVVAASFGYRGIMSVFKIVRPALPLLSK